jgi:uncharacterized membrane protein
LTSARDHLICWLEQGLVSPSRLWDALQLGGIYPSESQWGRFVDRLLLGLGVALLLSGIVSFFAANWGEIGRFGRFLLLDALILVALGAVWRLGLELLAGQAALFAAAVLVGVLLGVIGQVYQTGADVYELFAVWAILILPWVLLGRFALLWIFWLGLINLAAYLFYDTFHGFLGMPLGYRHALLVALLFNSFALAVWELAAARHVVWLQARWAPRILATAGGVPVTILSVLGIFDGDLNSGQLDVLIWLIWLAAMYLVYRRLRVDVFMLAGALLSLIVTAVAGLWRGLADFGDSAMGLLLIAAVVLGLSTLGGRWLTRVANRRER